MELNRISVLSRMGGADAAAGVRPVPTVPLAQEGGSPRSDSVRITYYDVYTAVEEGYIAVGGERIPVPESAAEAVRNAFEEAQRRNEAVQMSNMVKQTAYETEQQVKGLKDLMDTMKKALQIFRRIAKGGRVPPRDEKFLMDYSQELYMAAKAAALTAKKHKKYRSLLNDEEEEQSEAPEMDGTRYGAEASIGEDGDGGAAVDGASVAEIPEGSPL